MKTDWKFLSGLFQHKPSKASKAVVINSNYNGRSIKISLKDRIIIELDSNQSPSFQWIPSEKSLEHFSQIKVNYRSLTNGNTLPKKKVSRVTLGPQCQGKGVVTLHYLQPEQPESIIQTFSLTYEIIDEELSKLPPSKYATGKIIRFLKTHLL